MTKFLKGCLLLFICSLCGLFSSVVAQQPVRMFKVFSTCKQTWNTNYWMVHMSWTTNQDFSIASSVIENGIDGWNIIGAHPVDWMYANTNDNSFSVVLIDKYGNALLDNIVWTVTDGQGNKSSAVANMSVPTCKPLATPTPLPTPQPVQQPKDSCPAWAVQSSTGALICLWDLPAATSR